MSFLVSEHTMLLILTLLLSLAAITTAVPSTSHELGGHKSIVERQRQGGQNSVASAMENWTDGTAKVNCKSGKGGSYTVSWWGNKGNFVCGKGWNSGDARTVSYTGTIESAGNAYVSLYGWTRNPLVEWYVVEWYGTHKPCTGDDTTIKWLGNLTTDGEEYEICTKTRINKPSIDGTKTFPQFWSVRKTHRTNGTISSGAHFAAWTKAGLKLGKQQFMNLAVEGQDSNGTASFTVGSGTVLPTQS